MESRQVFLIALIAIGATMFSSTCFASVVSNQFNQVHTMAQKDDDSGKFTSCSGVANETFSFTWKPRVLMTGKTVVFAYDVVTLQDFVHGEVCVTVWLDQVPDPIYHDCRDQVCEDFKKVAQKFLPSLTCPIPKGFHLKQVLPIKLDPTIPLPAGKYSVKVSVNNEESKQVLCFSGDVEIQDEW